MSGIIDRLLGGNDSDETNDLTALRDLLAEREAELSLRAIYGQPYPNLQGKPTAVFPYTLYDENGEEYGTGAKEFVIPDNGLKTTDSPLVKFVGKHHGIGPDEVDFDALANVEGTEVDATLKENGDVEVSA